MYGNEILLRHFRNDDFLCLGNGSARTVYDLNDGYVAKIARNKMGFAQNRVEYQISMEEENHLLAKTVLMYDDYQINVMQKVEQIKSNCELKKQLWRAYGPYYFDDVKKLVNRYDLVIGDLKRHTSWGMLEGRPVLIDYGLTYDVRKRYYI